jgi:hypothetical protein
MTACIGIVRHGIAYLFADSAVTVHGSTPNPTGLPRSVFDESPHHDARGVVWEGTLKLFPISDDCVIAIAGDAGLAIQTWLTMRDGYTHQRDIPLLMESIGRSMQGEGGPAYGFDFLIAQSGPSGGLLWKWSSDRPLEIIRVEDFALIGRHSFHIDILRCTLPHLENTNDVWFFSLIAALFQQLVLEDYLLSTGVGGAIMGAAVTSEGVAWLPDTNYVLHDSTVSQFHIVCMRVRGEFVAMLSSSQSCVWKLGYFALSDDEQSALAVKADAMLEEIQNEPRAVMWVFLGTDKSTILLFHTHDTGIPACSRIQRDDETGTWRIECFPVLWDQLAARPPAPASGDRASWIKVASPETWTDIITGSWE